MPENDKPNLDLIQMVQQARMMHDAEATPSNLAAVYWIEAKCETDDCKAPTSRAGQWMVDVPTAEVDAIWEQVKAATKSGKLGYKSKVTTSPRSGARTDTRTIAVRTYDSADEADKSRIRTALDTLAIGGEWRYEADHAG